MLSYRHSYHAGNFADVLKHIVQIAIIEYLKKKDKPFTVHDTHGGAGSYAIANEHMQKTGEYVDGIGRLFGQRFGDPLLDRYLTLVAGLNPVGHLREYPGSPLISATLLREQDRLQCTELHSTDFPLLQQRFAGDKRVRVEKMDAWQGMRAMLPPTHRRGLVLIDPSYELEADYTDVLEGVREGLRRFATATYAVWYPVLDRQRTEGFVRRFVKAGFPDLLRVECCARADGSGRGMTGSGMLVINPPYTLAQQLSQTLPVLRQQLCDVGGHTLVKPLTAEH
ncbi:23S rRNA (adenine(2030)-N(6))-methyltransferase RlmJ [Alcanivorax hongdengensis]|nr:23S rRNA (adenine(2030)-N(6))-methyltransferase RlmJ [Alcanivorax hongdengensis]